MAFFVVAEPRERFEAWLRSQRGAAVAPSESLSARGKNVFIAARCVGCHAIDGVMDVAPFGPNLTHLASRSTIAAGTVTNSLDHLTAWVLDPQAIKPGANMPRNPLSDADLQALIAYLGNLK